MQFLPSALGFVGPARAQAGLHLWRDRHRALRLRLFRDVQYRDPGTDHLGDAARFFFHDMMWGPLAALTAEVFTPRLRYSGASMGFQLAAGSPVARRR